MAIEFRIVDNFTLLLIAVAVYGGMILLGLLLNRLDEWKNGRRGQAAPTDSFEMARQPVPLAAERQGERDGDAQVVLPLPDKQDLTHFANSMDRQAAVEQLAEKEFERIQREDPDFVARCGRDNILSDLSMEVAMSLPLDDEAEAQIAKCRAEDMEEEERIAEACRKMGIEPGDLNNPDVVTDILLNPERYQSASSTEDEKESEEQEGQE